MKRTVLYITGTRADYGLMRSTLRKIEESQSLDLELIVTGMHLMEEFGRTSKEVKRDGFKAHILDATYENDDKESMAVFIGKLIKLLAPKVKEIDPDVILLLGDRGEMLAGAIVGAYMAVPVAHIHGGDVSSTIDDSARHAITRLAHLHLAATSKSAERIIKMGEDPSKVFIVGAPGLDAILEEDSAEPSELEAKYGLDFDKPIVLVIQHPVVLDLPKPKEQIRRTLEAVSELKLQTILVYPNADAGGREMIGVIKEYSHHPFLKTFKSLPRKDYLALMLAADVIVGNSSSGIIESPSFQLPAVNVGSRQDMRERADNVIDVGYDSNEIKSAILRAIYDEKFKAEAKSCKNPYGNGKAGERIVEILSSADLGNELLQKKLSY